jgi:hypothetical protein
MDGEPNRQSPDLPLPEGDIVAPAPVGPPRVVGIAPRVRQRSGMENAVMQAAVIAAAALTAAWTTFLIWVAVRLFAG